MSGKSKRFTDDDLGSRATTMLNGLRTGRQAVETRWRTNEDLYNSKFPGGKSQGALKDRLFIPKTFSHIQRLLAKGMGAMFSDGGDVVSLTTWKNVPRVVGTIVETLLNYRLSGHPIAFYGVLYEALLDAYKYNHGIIKVYPYFSPSGEFSPRMEAVHPRNVFFSPQATWLTYHQHPIVHRMQKTRDELRRLGFKHVDDLKSDSDWGRDNNNSTNIFSDTRRESGQDPITCYEVWDFLPIDNSKYLTSCKYVVADGGQGGQRVIGALVKNDLPYKVEGEDYNRAPFFVGQVFPEPHEFYGKGHPEIVEPLQNEVNSIRNQTREAAALAIRAPVLIRRGAGIDMLALVNRRMGGAVEGDDISEMSVREFQTKDRSFSSYQEQQLADRDFFELDSVTPDLLGGRPSNEETALGVSSRVSNANEKLALPLECFNQTGVLPAIKAMLRLEQEYENDELIALVTGRMVGFGFASDGMPAREFIQGEYDFSVNVGAGKSAQFNRLNVIMQQAAVSNQVTSGLLQAGVIAPEDAEFINPMRILEAMLPALGERDIDAFKVQAQRGVTGAPAPGVGGQPRVSMMGPMTEQT